jgi:hypothetical protein
MPGPALMTKLLRVLAVRSAVVILLIFLASALGFQAPASAQSNVQGQWKTLPTQMPINPVHVSLMHTGKVLIVSGSGNLPSDTTYLAAVWDPATDTVTTQPVPFDMFCNGMVVLPDGRPFVMSGTLQYDPFQGDPRTAAYDPSTGNFVQLQSMAHGRWYPTATTLSDGSVMVFSGLDENSATNTTVEIYKVGSGWSQPFGAGWTPPLYPRMHLLPNGNVFYSGSTTSSAIFNPTTQKWTTGVASTNYSGTRTYGTSVLLPLTPANNYDPRIIIMGGGNPATNTTEIIDLGAANPVWCSSLAQPKAGCSVYGPPMSQSRIEMDAVILPNGKVLAVNGSPNDETGASLNADLYDPIANTFSSAGANAYARLYHSGALLLPDATVLVLGGNPARGTYEPRMEVYSPAYLFNSDGSLATRPTITGVTPGVIGYGGSFQIQTPNAANISSAVLVRPGSPTHAFDMDQRLVGLSFTVGNGVLNATAPPNGSIAPPGYYMLFVLNSAGVPSLASFIQLSLAPTDHPPTGTITSPSSNVSIGAGQAVNFSGTGSDPDGTVTGYSWSFPGGTPSSSSLANPGSVTYTTLGTYVASLTVTDNAGVSDPSPPTRVITVGPSFSLSSSPASQTVSLGGTTSYTVTVTPGNGFTGTVGFNVNGLPSGSTATFNPTTVSTSGSTTMTVVTGSAPAGIYPLTITGANGGLFETTNVTLALGVVDTPVITPGTGTYLNSVLISINDDTSGATIYYTTDGTMPTVTPNERYTGQFTLSASATVNAIAVASGFANSAMATANFTVQSGPSGLAAWWKFDDGTGTTAVDSSGNSNTLSLVNGISWVAGKIGGAISANGTNQYATEPGINLSATSAITVAFWANRTYSTTSESVMLESSTNYNYSTTGFGFFPDDTQCQGIQAALHGNVGYSTNCYTQPSSGVWHHLAIIYDKTQAGNAQTALYIDGVLQTPTSNLDTTKNTNSFGNNPIYLFSRAGSQFLNAGKLDDLRIYNRALTANEIQQLFQAGSASLVSIAVTPANPSIAKGASQQFTATGTYSDSSTQNLTSSVTWSSTNTAAAMIGSGGLATGVGTGTTTISATSGSISGSTTLTVTAPTLVSIAVTPANPSIAKGATQQFAATGTYSDNSTQNLTSSVTWSSTNTAVATITSAGLATAAGTGTATISAASGSISGSTNLSVTATLVSIAVTPTNPSISQGGTQQFTATGTYSDGGTLNITGSVTWSSTNTAVATISGAGLASGVAQGTTTIQAKSGSITGSTTLTVSSSSSSGLVSWWKFDDGTGTTAVDSSGNGNTLSLVNGISWVAGKIGGAISANGTNQYATEPGINLSATNTVTVAFWANRTYSTTVESVMLESSTNYNYSTTGFGFFPDDTQCQGIQAALHGNVGYSANCYVQPSSGVWHHLAIIYDKTQAGTAQTALYIDGVLQTPTSNLNDTAQNTNSFGNNPIYLFSRAGSQFLNAGKMDDLRIYNRALSATEIQQLFQAGSASLVSIAVTPANPSIAKGASQQFTATGTYSDSSTQNLTSSVTWSSTNTAAATISSAGLATAAGTGTTTISATSGSISGSTTLTVTAPVLVSIAVTPANPSIIKGGTQQFAATGTYSDNSTQNLTSSVTWSSTNTAVATISSAGQATGTGTGSTTISATSGSISGSTNLSVTATLVSIAVTPTNPSISQGGTQQFTATGTYSDGGTLNLTSSVTWSSTNTAVATISGTGLASGVAQGTTTIQATSGSITGSTTLTVSASVGLVGWWKFDDGTGTTAVDSSGNGNTLSLVNGISWITGKIGGAISANGTNQYATEPAINLSATNTVTVAFWANRTYSTTVESVMLESSTNYNYSTTGFGFFPDDTQCQGIQAAVHGNAGYSTNCYTQPSSGVWHHLAIIYDKTQAGNAQTALYVDGVLQTPTSNLNNTAQNSNSFGNNPIYLFSRAGSQFLNAGQLDDLRIYNRALSAAEIQQLASGH